MDRFIAANGAFPSSILISNEQIEVSPDGVFTHSKQGLAVVGLEANGRKHGFKISQAFADQLREEYHRTHPPAVSDSDAESRVLTSAI